MYQGRKRDIADRQSSVVIMESIEEDLRHLCARAKELGADRVSVLPSDRVIVDPRVRLKCLVPACPHYGVNLMCPPRVMGPEEFASMLDRYSHAILVQRSIPLKDRQGASLEDLMEDGEYIEALESSALALYDLVCSLEREAMNMGYRFAAGLGGGHCRRCDRCVGQLSGEPCRHPFRARPSMEALGIDVFGTAENAGMPLVSDGVPLPMWTALLLVD